MAQSPIPLQKWAYAIYLDVTSLKGVSSMKLHRDLGITQKTAWFMQQRIREDGHAAPESMVYTDGATAYRGRTNHEAVHHSVGEYVRGKAHTNGNGVESFWSMLKRAHHGTFHRLSAKHLHRYVGSSDISGEWVRGGGGFENRG